MTFEQELTITIIDKAIIGIAVLVIGYWLNRQLETYRSGEELRKEIAPLRANAYTSLWKLTEEVKKTRSTSLSQTEKAKIQQNLTSWYYAKGNALYLSLDAARLFFQARDSLKCAADDDIKKKFSALRTQLKVDCGVYNKRDAATQI